MPIEGYEADLLALIRKMEAKEGKEKRTLTKKRKLQCLQKPRGALKLECFMNFKGEGRKDGRRGKGGGK